MERVRCPEPVRPQLLAGVSPEGAWNALAELVKARGFRVERTQLFPANGQTGFMARVVTVADRLDDATAVKTLAHELAHILLHQPDRIDYHANRQRCEAEAESVAYLVCSELGLAADAYTFPYVATWAEGDIRVVTAAADKALACAEEILAAQQNQQEPAAA